MRRRRTAFAGRRNELGALDAALTDAGGAGRFVVLRGSAGSGKSALLDAAVRNWRSTGVQVIDARFGDPQRAADQFGFRSIVTAIRDHFEEIDEPRLAGSVGTLHQLSSATRASPSGVLGMVTELGAAFELIAARRPTVLAVDDADLAVTPVLALGAAARPGCLVVAVCGDDGSTGGAQIASRADLTIEVTDLSDEDVTTMLTQTRGVPPDDTLLHALRAALGPLAGNPGAVLSTVGDLAAQGRLVVARGHLCLVDGHEPVALPADHHLVGRVSALGPHAVRLATTVAIARVGVHDLPLLAAATRGRLAEYGQVLDRLVDERVLAVDAAGSITLCCPALANRLVLAAGPTGVARLHRVYAAALLRRVGQGDPADQAALADHMTSAGPAIPADQWTAAQLADAASAATEDEPDRAARWLSAALRHAGDGPATSQILHRLLRLLVRTGQYRRLAEVVDTIAVHTGPTATSLRRSADLAAAGVLAAVHTGTPVLAATARALVKARPDTRDQFDFCDRWFDPDHSSPEANSAPPTEAALLTDAEPLLLPYAGIPLLTDAELLQVTRALAIRPGAGQLDDPLLMAGSVGDLSTVFELVLGERYGAPVDGALGTYRRLVDRYAAGDLTSALSAARELELAAAAGTGSASPTHHLARLLATDIHLLRGDDRAAAAWLSGVPDEPPYGLLRWWVQNASVLWPATNDAAVLRDGWRAYRRQQAYGSRLGLDQALPLMAAQATRLGPEAVAEVRAEVDDLDQRPEAHCAPQTMMLVRALVVPNSEAAQASADLLRRQGHRSALLRACVALAQVADEPGPWLHEAYEVAKALESTYLRSRLHASMREYGLNPPRTRTPRTTFSAVELQIIELIRDGRTNRQIAAKVRMSEKTIENYLTRLFARTGCRSRVELAAASLTGSVVTRRSDGPCRAEVA